MYDLPLQQGVMEYLHSGVVGEIYTCTLTWFSKINIISYIMLCWSFDFGVAGITCFQGQINM